MIKQEAKDDIRKTGKKISTALIVPHCLRPSPRVDSVRALSHPPPFDDEIPSATPT